MVCHKVILSVVILFTLGLLVGCQQIDVLKITNVPFPSSDFYDFAATARTGYQGNVSGYTVCYRHLIHSNNDGVYCPVLLSSNITWTFAHRIYPPGDGGVNGYTGSIVTMGRNIPGGGLGQRAFPDCKWPLFPIDIDISKWYHICASYSSTLHHVHMYMDTFKVFSYTYQDPQEDPLPSSYVEKLRIGSNMRGLITDVQIYDSYFDAEKLAAHRRGCNNQPGQILSWDAQKLNITQVK